MDFTTAYARQMDTMKYVRKQFGSKEKDAIDIQPKTKSNLRYRLAHHLIRLAAKLEPKLRLTLHKLDPHH